MRTASCARRRQNSSTTAIRSGWSVLEHEDEGQEHHHPVSKRAETAQPRKQARCYGRFAIQLLDGSLVVLQYGR